MKKEELLLFLQDIVEESSMLLYLKIHYTEKRKNHLNTLKEIVRYGLENCIFELSECIMEDTIETAYYKDFDIEESLKIIEKDSSWTENKYCLFFIDTTKYYWILFGPYGPVGENAFEGAKIPDEFAKFIIE